MTLVRYNNPLSLFPSFNRLFDTVIDQEDTTAHYRPSVDVIESEEAYELQIALPGIPKNAIKIDVKDQLLTISGEKKRRELKEGEKQYRMENSYGRFERKFELPDVVAIDGATAHHEDGILTLILPKEKKVEVAKQIKIK